MQPLFSNTLAFLQLLLVLAISAATWKCYKYYKRHQHEQRRARMTRSQFAFNYQLPPEIIEEIFRYLDPGSLLAAAQVNRTWHEYSHMDSIRGALFERESLKPMSLQEIEEELNFENTNHLPVKKIDYSSSPYPKRWFVEDNILSKRLNMKIIDVTLLSAGNMSLARIPVDLKNYLLKTRIKWTEDDPLFIKFGDSYNPIFQREISKNVVPIEHNIGEEYEIIVRFDKMTQYFAPPALEIHRFRVTKTLNPLKGLMLILLLIYAPILLKDIIAILRDENSENLTHVLVHWAGIIMNIYLDGSLARDIYKAYRRQSRYIRNHWRLRIGAVFFLLIVIESLRRNFAIWRNMGLCWIIGMTLYEYFKFAQYFWIRRYQIGLNKSKLTILMTILLFVYAVDWPLLIESITTGRIWRTLIINLTYSLSTMLMINFEKVVIESLYALRLTWSGAYVPMKAWVKGISAQIFVVVIFAMYSPAGFDNLYNK